MTAVGFNDQTGAGAFLAVTPGTTIFTVPASTTYVLDKLTITNTDIAAAQAYSLFHIPSGGSFSGDDYIIIKNRGIDPSDGTVGHGGTEDVREMAGEIFEAGDKLVIFAATASKLKASWSGVKVT